MIDDPYVKKGNPRFCTQYVNSVTGEHIGPMLSGTASWLSTVIRDILGCSDISKPLSPVPTEDGVSYTLKSAKGEFSVKITRGSSRAKTPLYTLDGKDFDGVLMNVEGRHDVTVTV